jgi:hypothetical protein
MDARAEDCTPTALGARLRFALEMVETGVEMMRCNLRRTHPDATEAQLQELLNDWLLLRPTDEFSGSSTSALRLRKPTS